jgi:predicted RNase H-like HicB family nuclease
MKKLVWFMAGIALGAVAARQIEENPAARKAYEEAKASLQEFKDAVLEGYQEKDAELAKPKRKPTATKSTGSTSKPSGE